MVERIASIPSPHLVPLPMGEETSTRLSLIYKMFCELLANLASPLGRGARQHPKGTSCGARVRGTHVYIDCNTNGLTYSGGKI